MVSNEVKLLNSLKVKVIVNELSINNTMDINMSSLSNEINECNNIEEFKYWLSCMYEEGVVNSNVEALYNKLVNSLNGNWYKGWC